MKRRNVIRNIATGSLLVSGVGSAAASNRGSGSTMYKLEKDGDTFEVVETFDSGVGIETHCGGTSGYCCMEKCCDCNTDYCDICYCHRECDDEQLG